MGEVVAGTGTQGLSPQGGTGSDLLPPWQRFQDTSQYVVAELQALENEQKQIDARAAVVEKDLRSLMESGAAPGHIQQPCGQLGLVIRHCPVPSPHPALWPLSTTCWRLPELLRTPW